MIILRLLLLLTNLHLKLLSTQGTGADKLLSTQRVKYFYRDMIILKLLLLLTNLHLKLLSTQGTGADKLLPPLRAMISVDTIIHNCNRQPSFMFNVDNCMT